MGLMEKLKNMTNREDEYEEDTEDMQEEASNRFDDDYSTKSKSKILSIPSSTQVQVIVEKPEKFIDASEIADHFKSGKVVVLNLEIANKEIAARLRDFLGGVCYAIDGDIKKISNTTYIMVPYNVDISGALINETGDIGDIF